MWPWNVETWWDGPLFSIFTLRMDEINYAMGWVTIGAGAKWSFESAFHWKIGCYLCSDEGVWSGDVWVSARWWEIWYDLCDTWQNVGDRSPCLVLSPLDQLVTGSMLMVWKKCWGLISRRPLDGDVNLFRGMRMHGEEFKASFCRVSGELSEAYLNGAWMVLYYDLLGQRLDEDLSIR